MSKIGSYEIELVNLSPRQWNAFLMEHSNLPGPRANIELAKAFARIGTLMDFKKQIQLGPQEAAENTPREFLCLSGVLGYGQYLAKHHDGGLLRELRQRANDPRPRIREAVVIALQTIGQAKMDRLLRYAKSWVEGTFFEQRAAIAAVCTPDFMKSKEVCLATLEMLDWVTATMVRNDDERRDRGYQALQKTLSSAWSVAVAALPEKGKSMMERWIKERHPVVSKIMSENLKGKRLSAVAPDWTTYWLQEISG